MEHLSAANHPTSDTKRTPKLFTALFFNQVDDSYEVNAVYVAAMNSKQAEDILVGDPAYVFGVNCQRFIHTDEMMALHPVNAHILGGQAHNREVINTAQYQSWVHGQTTATEDDPAAFRSF